MAGQHSFLPLVFKRTVKPSWVLQAHSIRRVQKFNRVRERNNNGKESS